MCGYFRIGSIDFMLQGKSLLDYNNYFLLTNIKRMTNNTKVFSTAKKLFY